MMIHRQLINNPGMYAIVVRPTYSSIRTTLIPQLRDKILKYGFTPHQKNPIIQAYGGEVPSQLIYRNGSRMFFAGMDRDPDKVLGGEYDIIFYNQVEQGKKEHWEILASRMLEARHGMWLEPYGKRSLLIGDCNPSRKRHWILERAIQDNNLFLYYMGLQDNPELYDGADWTQTGINYVEDSKKTLTGMQLRRGLYGEWCSPEGIVYSQYDPDVHDIEEQDIPIKANWFWSAACDHGSIHPFVFHLYCGPPDKSELYLYKEIYKTNLDVDEMRDMVSKLLETHLPSGRSLKWTVADHRPDINKSLMKLGIPIEPADKEVLPGIQTVQETLSAAKIRFNKNSLVHAPDQAQKNAGNPIRTTDEFDRYSYKEEEKMDGSEKDEYPIKAYDDGLDTLRYELVKWSQPQPEYIKFNTSVPMTPPSIF